MKAIVQSSIFRALCAIAIGVMLLKYPHDGITWLTIAIGVLFLVSGIIALIAYWNARKHASEYTITDRQGRVISGSQPTFPIVGLGSVILGLVLALTPGAFLHGLMYVLGGIMILGGANQLVALVTARRMGPMPFFFWIAPSLILLTGLYVVLKPMHSAELPLMILGWCCLVYGVAEIINAIKIHTLRKQFEAKYGKPEEEAPVAEEISSEMNAIESTSDAQTDSNGSEQSTVQQSGEPAATSETEIEIDEEG